MTSIPHVETGTVIGGYRIDAIAGQGGMGVVYRATQLGLDRVVALKLITAELAGDAAFRSRFESEAQLAASIDHPNVVPVYGAGEADGVLFLAMRFVEGTDLRALVAAEGGLDAEHAVRIVWQVAGALDAAHRRGLVHRDVKPPNVLIASEGDEHVYLTDFGLTKHAAAVSGFTRTGVFVGTPDFAAPEQIRGERADARADVYALGAVLFHAVTGQVPFPRDSELAKMYAHLNDPAPSVAALAPGAPAGLDVVVATAMAKDPAARYDSAGDLARAAWSALQGDVAPALMGTRRDRRGRRAGARARHAAAERRILRARRVVRRRRRFPQRRAGATLLRRRAQRRRPRGLAAGPADRRCSPPCRACSSPRSRSSRSAASAARTRGPAGPRRRASRRTGRMGRTGRAWSARSPSGTAPTGSPPTAATCSSRMRGPARCSGSTPTATRSPASP